MTVFYKPSTTDPTLTDALGNPINYQQYKQAGGLGTEGGGGWTDVMPGNAPGYAPLPSLAGTQQQQNPIDIFNLKLMELLQKAQSANTGNPALMAQGSKLQNLQTTQSMVPASELGISNLAPGDMMSARQNVAQLYNPEVKALNERMQLNNEAITRFEKTLGAATKMGEQYAKMIKPSEETVEAIKMQMRAGVLPSEDVLTKVQGQLTEDDWNKYVAAKAGPEKQPTGIQEYEYVKKQGFTGTYQQWLDRPSQYKGTAGTKPKNEYLAVPRKAISLPAGKAGPIQPAGVDYYYYDLNGNPEKITKEQYEEGLFGATYSGIVAKTKQTETAQNEIRLQELSNKVQRGEELTDAEVIELAKLLQ